MRGDQQAWQQAEVTNLIHSVHRNVDTNMVLPQLLLLLYAVFHDLPVVSHAPTPGDSAYCRFHHICQVMTIVDTKFRNWVTSAMSGGVVQKRTCEAMYNTP